MKELFPTNDTKNVDNVAVGNKTIKRTLVMASNIPSQELAKIPQTWETGKETPAVVPLIMDDVDDENDKKGAVQKMAKEPKQAKVKRTWKKPKDMPRQPLSAYNLFFQHEREKIVFHHGNDESFETATPSYHTNYQPRGPSHANKPQQAITNHPHRRKIGFANLARIISAKWKDIDPESKQPFINAAERDKERYKIELAKWKHANTGATSSQQVNGDYDASVHSYNSNEVKQGAEVLVLPAKRFSSDQSTAATAENLNKAQRDSRSAPMTAMVRFALSGQIPPPHQQQPRNVPFPPQLCRRSGPPALIYNDPSYNMQRGVSAITFPHSSALASPPSRPAVSFAAAGIAQTVAMEELHATVIELAQSAAMQKFVATVNKIAQLAAMEKAVNEEVAYNAVVGFDGNNTKLIRTGADDATMVPKSRRSQLSAENETQAGIHDFSKEVQVLHDNVNRVDAEKEEEAKQPNPKTRRAGKPEDMPKQPRYSMANARRAVLPHANSDDAVHSDYYKLQQGAEGVSPAYPETKQHFINCAERNKKRCREEWAKWRGASMLSPPVQHANVGNGAASVNSDGNQQQPTKAQRISLHHGISVPAEAKTSAPPPALNNTQKNSLAALLVAMSRQNAPSRLPLPPPQWQRQQPQDVVFFPRLWPTSGPLASFYNDPTMQQSVPPTMNPYLPTEKAARPSVSLAPFPLTVQAKTNELLTTSFEEEVDNATVGSTRYSKNIVRRVSADASILPVSQKSQSSKTIVPKGRILKFPRSVQQQDYIKTANDNGVETEEEERKEEAE